MKFFQTISKANETVIALTDDELELLLHVFYVAKERAEIEDEWNPTPEHLLQQFQALVVLPEMLASPGHEKGDLNA